MFKKLFSVLIFIAAISQASAQGVTPGSSGPITAAAGSFASGSLVDWAETSQ